MSAGNGFVLMRWAAPREDGGSPISGYEVTISAAGGEPKTIRTNETFLLVSGLGNGVEYTLAVRAINGAGTGTSSEPISTKPRERCERSFVPHRKYKVGSSPSGLATGDLTGTGRVDVVVANQAHDPGSGTVGVLFNDGAANLARQVEYAVTDFPFALAIADLDRDGAADILVGGSRESVLYNGGDGRFRTREDFGHGSESVAVADVDRDGLPDVALVSQGNPGALLFMNQGARTFGTFQVLGEGTRPYSVAFADLNGDGNPDLVVGFQDQVSILLGNGDGSFSPQISYSTTSGVLSLGLEDFDGDGYPDIALSNEDVVAKEIVVLFNDGDGRSFTEKTFPAGRAPFHVTVTDVDHDGRPDLAYTDESHFIGVLLNRGRRTFSAPMVFDAGPEPFSITAADLNEDGFPDIVVATPRDNSLGVFLNVCRD